MDSRCASPGAEPGRAGVAGEWGSQACSRARAQRQQQPGRHDRQLGRKPVSENNLRRHMIAGDQSHEDMPVAPAWLPPAEVNPLPNATSARRSGQTPCCPVFVAQQEPESEHRQGAGDGQPNSQRNPRLPSAFVIGNEDWPSPDRASPPASASCFRAAERRSMEVLVAPVNRPEYNLAHSRLNPTSRHETSPASTETRTWSPGFREKRHENAIRRQDSDPSPATASGGGIVAAIAKEHGRRKR